MTQCKDRGSQLRSRSALRIEDVLSRLHTSLVTQIHRAVYRKYLEQGEYQFAQRVTESADAVPERLAVLQAIL